MTVKSKRDYVLSQLSGFERRYYLHRHKPIVVLAVINLVWYLIDAIRLGGRDLVWAESYAWVASVVLVVVYALSAVLFRWMMDREREILRRGGYIS